MIRVLPCLGCLLPFLVLVTAANASPRCNPYRDDYESAIAQGLLRRPSLVSGPAEAWALFQAAIARDDRVEVAARAAQYLVIVSEGSGVARADRMRREIEDEMIERYQQPVEVAVPMLGVILPDNHLCPLDSSPPATMWPTLSTPS